MYYSLKMVTCLAEALSIYINWIIHLCISWYRYWTYTIIARIMYRIKFLLCILKVESIKKLYCLIFSANLSYTLPWTLFQNTLKLCLCRSLSVSRKFPLRQAETATIFFSFSSGTWRHAVWQSAADLLRYRTGLIFKDRESLLTWSWDLVAEQQKPEPHR